MGVVSLSVLTLLVICSYPGWAHSFSEFSGDVDQAWTPEGIAKTYLKYYNHGRNFSEVYDGANTQAPSPQCKKDLEVYTAALLSPGNHTWALLMYLAQPPDDKNYFEPGTLLGRAEYTGSYVQCLWAEATHKPVYITIPIVGRVKVGDHNFDAHYCKERYIPADNSSLVGFSRGRCVPASCDRTDILKLMPDQPGQRKYAYCGTKLPLKENTGGIVALVLVGVFLELVVISTMFDTFYKHWENRKKAEAKTVTESVATNPIYGLHPQDVGHANTALDRGHINAACDIRETNVDVEMRQTRRSEGKLDRTEELDEFDKLSSERDTGPSAPIRALLAFSLWQNLPSVLSTKSRGYNCMNGVRFLTMSWIILGHSYQLEFYVLNDPRTMLAANFYGQFELLSRFPHMIINNMSIGVNCFFFLSGTLVTVSFLKTLRYLKGQSTNRGANIAKEMALYVFHRYWRLTPLYAALILIVANLWMYLGHGPLWPEWYSPADNCRSTWWTNLLYINNLVETDSMCMGWSWYLANDFQFYLIVPLFATALFLSPIGGGILLFLGWGGSLAARIVMFDRDPTDFQYEAVYIKPWCRFGPYAIGIGMGYILYRTKCNVKMNKIVVLIGWLLAFSLGMLVIFGIYNRGEEGCEDCVIWNKAMSVAYNATKHDAFTLGIAWMVFACCCGYGGLINSFLSWGLWIPLSKLTYAGYLVHPIIHFVSLALRMQTFYVQDLTVIFQYLGTLMLTIVVSLGLTLVFEVPFLALEKVILPKRKKKYD